MTYQVGDHIAVWWETGTRRNGNPIARVLEVKEYRGPFNGQGTHSLHVLCILRLTAAPSASKKGWIEMSILKGNEPDIVDLAVQDITSA